MAPSLSAVEEILRYRFKNWKLLEEALTHPSHPDSPSYQRLEFVGDAVLGLAISNYVFLAYPRLPPGGLSLLRAANVSTEKLARVAVRHGLYLHMRHSAASLDFQIREFAEAVEKEGRTAVYGRSVKAPKVLADIVESVAAAVYIDANFDLQRLWVIFRDLLEPIFGLEDLENEPQPVTLLFNLCQKQGKQVDIKYWRKGVKGIASVYVDGSFIVSASSEHKEIARMNAARAALAKLCNLEYINGEEMELSEAVGGNLEVEEAERKLSKIRGKWTKPELIKAVEKIIGYTFKEWSLLEEALTHPSFSSSISYERLEFLGDAALNLAFGNHVYLVYPTLDPGKLSLLRAANVSTEKLGRVTIRNELYQFMRCNASSLNVKVREFAKTLKLEGDADVYGGSVKAPKVLADILEAVAAAIYVDLDFDLQELWVRIRAMFEPVVTLEDIKTQPQPVTMLFELCQKVGKMVKFEHWYKDMMNTVSVYVDGKFIASGSSKQKDIAKFNAAKAALSKLEELTPIAEGLMEILDWINGPFEIEAAKQKLRELCEQKKWPTPSYGIEKEEGPPHQKRYVCYVQVKPPSSPILCMIGDEKTRIRDAENCAASLMIRALHEHNFL